MLKVCGESIHHLPKSALPKANLPPVTDIYQSNGACYDQCISSYAFAILLGEDCWCSNYAPADTVDVSECDTPCPGYPDDLCGNTSQDLYGYIALTISPSGTIGASSSASSTSSSSAPSTSTVSSYFSLLHSLHSSCDDFIHAMSFRALLGVSLLRQFTSYFLLNSSG